MGNTPQKEFDDISDGTNESLLKKGKFIIPIFDDPQDKRPCSKKPKCLAPIVTSNPGGHFV